MSHKNQYTGWRVNQRQFSARKPSVITYCSEIYWNPPLRTRQLAITQLRLNMPCTRIKQWLHSLNNLKTLVVNFPRLNSKIQCLSLKLYKIAHKVSRSIKSNHQDLELILHKKWGYKNQKLVSRPLENTPPDLSMRKSHWPSKSDKWKSPKMSNLLLSTNM